MFSYLRSFHSIGWVMLSFVSVSAWANPPQLSFLMHSSYHDNLGLVEESKQSTTKYTAGIELDWQLERPRWQADLNSTLTLSERNRTSSEDGLFLTGVFKFQLVSTLVRERVQSKTQGHVQEKIRGERNL